MVSACAVCLVLARVSLCKDFAWVAAASLLPSYIGFGVLFYSVKKAVLSRPPPLPKIIMYLGVVR
jgi:hypothetical protein